MTSNHPDHLSEDEAKQLWARAAELQAQAAREEESKSEPERERTIMPPKQKVRLVLWAIIACPLIVANHGCGRTGSTYRPTVGVIPFDAVGSPSESAALRDYATQLNDKMEEVLAGDPQIKVLPTDPDERPRNPETQLIEGLRYLVGATVTRDSVGTLLLSWRLLSVEDGTIVEAGNVSMVSGSEADSIAAVGRRITAQLLAAHAEPN